MVEKLLAERMICSRVSTFSHSLVYAFGSFKFVTNEIGSPNWRLLASLLRSICCFVGLSPMLIRRPLLRTNYGPYFSEFLSQTFCRSMWSPMNSARLCWPTSLWVCMYIWEIVLFGRHSELAILTQRPTPNFIKAIFKISTSLGWNPGDKAKFHRDLDCPWHCMTISAWVDILIFVLITKLDIKLEK